MQSLIFGLLVSVAAAPGGTGIASIVTNGAASVGANSVPAAQVAALPAASNWVFKGESSADCELQTDGSVLSDAGAELWIQCDAQGSVFGNVMLQLPVAQWRQRRVTISAEINTSDSMNASLWLKTQRDTQTLMFDDDTEQSLFDDGYENGGWARREITLPVAADAGKVSLGVMLQGSGRLALRDVRVVVSRAGTIAPEAAQLLDAAIQIVKTRTHDGAGTVQPALRWQVLEPQLRVLASGAQTTADVYPVIRYLLSQLGDKRSLLMTPELATAMKRSTAAAAASGNTTAPIEVFNLPDGARLVLSRVITVPATDQSVALATGRTDASPLTSISP